MINFNSKTDEELLEILFGHSSGVKDRENCRMVLDMRQNERLKIAYESQAQSTKKLVKVTWILAIATWVLVVATILAPHIGVWLSRPVGH